MRSYAYICSLGAEGLREASEIAVLNANYLLALLQRPGVGEHLPLAFGERCMHEFVLSGAPMKRDLGIRTTDLAKRLLDFGYHPPTVYFPLLVEEALLVEPTETETRETLEAFAEVVAEILREAAEDPEIARQAPYSTPVRRLDEAAAARTPGRPPAPPRRARVALAGRPRPGARRRAGGRRRGPEGGAARRERDPGRARPAGRHLRQPRLHPDQGAARLVGAGRRGCARPSDWGIALGEVGVDWPAMRDRAMGIAAQDARRRRAGLRSAAA